MKMKYLFYTRNINKSSRRFIIFILVIDLQTKILYLNLLCNNINRLILVSNKLRLFFSFYFLSIFSERSCILNIFIKSIYKVLLSWYFKYQLYIEFIGIGYKFFFRKNLIYCILGYSHLIRIKLPKKCNICFKNNEKLLILINSNKYILSNLLCIIKNLRKFNIYKGVGLKNIYDKINLKLGKIKSIIK